MSQEVPKEIRWEAVGVDGPVRVEFSCDNGANWELLAENAPVGEPLMWTVPEMVGQEMLVRVSNDAGFQDRSDGVFSMNATREVTLFDFGSVWQFHDSGVDLGDDWNSIDYDDSDWKEGPGELGYGDGDESTLLEKAQPDVHPTAYFRKTMELDAIPDLSEFQVIFDDAVAVWLNDEMIFFENFGNGSSYEAWASESAGDNALLTVEEEALPWVIGDNVLGVMVKQRSADSSDLSFDMAVQLTFDESDVYGRCPSGPEGDTGQETEEAEGECSCTSTGNQRSTAWLFGVLGAMLLARRRS